MTPQEIFNTVATHLFTQGKQSIDPELDGNGCVYRGPDGCKCAVGVLIPDEMYQPQMEGVRVTSFGHFEELAQHLDLMDGEKTGLMSALQKSHDQASNWISTQAMRTRLMQVARVYSLDDSNIHNLRFQDR